MSTITAFTVGVKRLLSYNQYHFMTFLCDVPPSIIVSDMKLPLPSGGQSSLLFILCHMIRVYNIKPHGCIIIYLFLFCFKLPFMLFTSHLNEFSLGDTSARLNLIPVVVTIRLLTGQALTFISYRFHFVLCSAITLAVRVLGPRICVAWLDNNMLCVKWTRSNSTLSRTTQATTFN